MRLTVKLLLWFLLCVALGLGINAYVSVRGELARYEAAVAAQHVVTGRVLKSAFVEVMAREGEKRAISVLASSDKDIQHVDLRWVHFTADAPPSHRPGVPLELVVGPIAHATDEAPLHVERDGILHTFVRIDTPGQPTTAIELTESLEGEREVVRRTIVHEIRAVGLVGIAIAVVASIVGAIVVARPMQRLVEHARRIGRGDLSQATVTPTHDEISDLAGEMNTMCVELGTAREATIKALDQLRHAERLTTVGKLASGLAHELGTPLNVITLRAKSIERNAAADPAIRESAQSIAEQATRMTELVRRLLDFARRKPPKSESVVLDALVRRVSRLLDPIATKAKVTIAVEADDDVPTVRGDAAQLEQVLTNLVLNAIQAMPGGGTVTVAMSRSDRTPPADYQGHATDFVRIAVRDEGTGINDADLPHIFEPFFTTKDIGAGTGLGLAVCYGIVKDHEGFFDVSSTPSRGAELGVNLPEIATT